MKFTCSVQELASAVSCATRALPARSNSAVQEGILVRTNENGIDVTCNDGNISIKGEVMATVEQTGAVVMPGKLFCEMLRKMPEGTIDIETDEKNLMKLKCGTSKMNVSGMDAAEYSEMREIGSSFALHLPKKKLSDMINRVTFAIAVSESRPILTGCLLEVTREELRLVALDGYRLAIQSYSDTFVLPDGKEKVSVVIPGKIINEIAHVLTLNDDVDMATFHMDSQHFEMINGSIVLCGSLLMGDYINYRHIVPTTWQTRITVQCRELQDAVERASLIAKEDKSNLVRMSISGNNLKIYSMSDSGSSDEELEVNVEGEPLEIAFNARYIIDVIRNIDQECCCLCMNTSISPCVIKPTDGESFLFMILPVRVYN